VDRPSLDEDSTDSESTSFWACDDGPNRFPLWIHHAALPRPPDVPHESPVFLQRCVELASRSSRRTFSITLGLRPGVKETYPWYPWWGLPIGEPLELHCDRSRPTLVLLARTSGIVQPRANLFGIRFCLDSKIASVFPLLVADGPASDSVRMLHPFLHGYSGSVDRSLQSSSKSYYVVAHGWDGGGVFSNFGTAWCSDTGFRDLTPHGSHPHLSTLKGYRDWDSAHVAWTERQRLAPIPPTGPCMPASYICQQFFAMDYRYLEDLVGREALHHPFISTGRMSELHHASFRSDPSAPGEYFYDARSPPPIPHRVEVPASPSQVPSSLWEQSAAVNSVLRNPPSFSPSYHTPSPSVYSERTPPRPATPSTPAPSAPPPPTPPTRTEDLFRQESGWQRDRNRAMDRMTANDDMSIPLRKSDVEGWLLRFHTLFRRDCWSPGGLCILDHPSTSASNEAASRDLSQVILQLALKDKTDKVFHELNGAGGAGLLAKEAGIELFHHLKLRLAPQDMSHLWEYYRDWAGLQHKSQETISGFSSRLETKRQQLSKLTLSTFQIKFKLAFSVIDGPYREVFKHTYQKLCVDKDPAWDLERLSYDHLTEQLETTLKGSRYYSNGELQKGQGAKPDKVPYAGKDAGRQAVVGSADPNAKTLVPGAPSADIPTVHQHPGLRDWMSYGRYSDNQKHALLRSFQCPFCRDSGPDHRLSNCQFLADRGYNISFAPANDKGDPRAREKQEASRARLAQATPDEPKSQSSVSFASPPASQPPTSTAPTGFQAMAPPDLEDREASDYTDDASADSGDFTDWGVQQSEVLRASAARVHDASNRRKVLERGPKGRRTTSHTPSSSNLISKDDVNKYSERLLADPAVPLFHLCVDSGATKDMFNDKGLFYYYKDISAEGRHVIVADDATIPILGLGHVRFNLAGRTVELRNVLHVPELQMPLLSVRTHRRRGPGCSFLADASGCWLTFPSLCIEIDDTADCLLPFSYSSATDSPEYAQPRTIRSRSRAYLATTVKARRVAVEQQQTSMTHPTPDPALKPADGNDNPFLPAYSIPESFAPKVRKWSGPELHKMFGSRHLPNYKLLEHLGSGLHVHNPRQSTPTIGDMVNLKRGPRGKLLERPRGKLHTIGMDIGYGDGKSPGGFTHCLVLVDLATRHAWTYGLPNTSGTSIVDALWRFFIDAGGFPKRVRCDFDKRLVQGDVGRLLKANGVTIGASPPPSSVPKRGGGTMLEYRM
jgi:hypothetical protein